MSETITIRRAGADAARERTDERNKQVMLKNRKPFTKYISQISNTEADNAEYLDLVIPIYNLVEYSDNYAKTSEILWQHHKYILSHNIKK